MGTRTHRGAPTFTGTAHYATLGHARWAYGEALDDALDEGRIKLGPPPVPDGCTLMTDATGRYFICSYSGAPAPA